MKIVFRPPNFNCQVSHKGRTSQTKSWVLCYAQDENEAKTVLETFGYITHQVKPYDFEAAWRVEAKAEFKRAAQVIQPLVAAGRRPVYEAKPGQPPPDYRFQDKLWSQLKVHLMILFHNKCAYCESDFTDVGMGDVEHYRPKGRVRDDPQHPGYWWLAYEPTNYVPSCRPCNQFFKKDLFPLMQGSPRIQLFQADLQQDLQPADLYQDLQPEKPVIVNPYAEDPADYLDFIPVFKTDNLNLPGMSSLEKAPGLAIPKDPRGIEMITLLQLNREMLVTKRRQAQDHVRVRFMQAFGNMNREAKERLVREILEGRQEFPTAAMAEVRAYCAEMGISPPF